MKTIYLIVDNTIVGQIAANSRRAGLILNKMGETPVLWSEKQPPNPPYIAMKLDDNFELSQLGSNDKNEVESDKGEQNINANQFLWKALNPELHKVLLKEITVHPVVQDSSMLTKELFTEHYNEQKLNDFKELKFISDNYSLFDALVDDFNQFAHSLKSIKEVDFKEILPTFKNWLKALVNSINENKNLASVQKVQCMADIIRFQHAALGIKDLSTLAQLRDDIPRALTNFISFEIKKKEKKGKFLASVMQNDEAVDSDKELHNIILNYQECFAKNIDWEKSEVNLNDTLSLKEDLNISENDSPVLEKNARTSENHCVLLYVLLQEKANVNNINTKFGCLLDGINKKDFANFLEKAQADKLLDLLMEIVEEKGPLSKYKSLLLDALALLINNPNKDKDKDQLLECLKNNTVLCDYIAANILKFTGHKTTNENIQYKTTNVFEDCSDKQKLQLNILFADRKTPEREKTQQKKSKYGRQNDVLITTKNQWSEAVTKQFKNVCTPDSSVSENPLDRIDLSYFINNFTALEKQCAESKEVSNIDRYLPEIVFEKARDICDLPARMRAI